MTGLAHVITVDPTGAVARLVRAAFEVTGDIVIQVDVRDAETALAEIQRGGCQLLVTSFRLNGARHGIDLAVSVRQAFADVAVLVLGDVDDPIEQDADLQVTVPFAYLHRPVEGAQFIRALAQGLGKEMPVVRASSGGQSEADADFGVIPPLDMKVAERVVNTLLVDVGAMAIVVANRAGDVLLERGAVGYLNREQLAGALLPAVRTNIDMGRLVGGQPAALQFYDGDTYDVFVLSIGFHHFMCLVFDGQAGSRQFGAVNRFGRRAAEDLIALLGINAFALAPARAPAAPEPVAPAEEAPLAEPIIERAQAWVQVEHELLPEPEPLRLEPVENLDMNLFDDMQLGELDLSAADDLFNPETLAEIANETRRERGPLTYDEARELGIIP
jgi:hypothetical protein